MRIWRIFIATSMAFVASNAVAAPILIENFKLICGDLFDSSLAENSIEKRWKDLESDVILASEFPHAKTHRAELNSLRADGRLGITFAKYLSRLRFLETHIDRLTTSSEFKTFLESTHPDLQVTKEFIEYLKTDYANSIEGIANNVQHSPGFKYSEWKIRDFQYAQEKIVKGLKDKPFALEILVLERAISEYATWLNAKNYWDAAVPLELYRVVQVRNNMGQFFPIRIFIKDAKYEVIRVLRSGGEHQVLWVRDLTTGIEQVLKVGNSYSRYGGDLEQQRQLLNEAGLPVVKIEQIEKGFYFAEKLEIFGSDVVLEFLKTGSHPELKDLVDFYKFILEKSPYDIHDLKFSNLGRRTNGSWVIADWVIGANQQPFFLRTDLPTEIRGSIQSSIIEAYRKLDEQRTSITRLYLAQLIRRFESEGLLSRGQVENIHLMLAQ